MLHAAPRQHSRSFQFIQKIAVDFQLLFHLQSKPLGGPSPFALLLQRGQEALFIHIEPSLFGHVPRQIQRETIGIVQLKSLVARNHSLPPRAQVINQLIQQIQPHIQRALKTLLLLSNGLQDELPPGLKLAEVRPHFFDHHFGDLAQEQAREADLAAKASRTTQNHPQHIVAPFVTWQYPITYQESHCAAVICNDPIGYDVLFAFSVTMPKHFLNMVHD